MKREEALELINNIWGNEFSISVDTWTTVRNLSFNGETVLQTLCRLAGASYEEVRKLLSEPAKVRNYCLKLRLKRELEG